MNFKNFLKDLLQDTAKMTCFEGFENQENNAQKRIENGRSMIEMLGVLAIIGVISIGAIAGYRYAMDKYRVNQTVNDIQMRINDLITQAMKGQETVDLSPWSATSAVGYTFLDGENDYGISEDGFAFLTVSGVPQNVCRMLEESMPQYDFIINGDRDECAEENNDIIVFNVSEEVGNATVDWSGYEQCDDETPCPGECHVCTGGRCIDSNHKCGAGKYCVGGSCTSCKRGSFESSSGACYECDESTVVAVKDDGKGCNQCADRIYLSGEKKCYPDCESLGNKEFAAAAAANIGKCATHFIAADGKAYPCTKDQAITVKEQKDCEHCGNKRSVLKGDKTKCVPECGANKFVTNGYSCISCDNIGIWWSFWVDTTVSGHNYTCRAACPNRAHHSGNQCSLCATGEFLGSAEKTKNGYDSCFSCDIDDDVFTTHTGDSFCTNACKNRVMVGQFCVKKCTMAEAEQNGGACPPAS